LLGVQLHRQAEGLGLVENARDLRRGETDGLAEGVDRVGKPRRGDSRQHVLADRRDIGILVAGRFRRQRMGAEEGRRHRELPLVAQPPRRAQRLHLIGPIKAVARLHFHGRHALAQQGIDAR